MLLRWPPVQQAQLPHSQMWMQARGYSIDNDGRNRLA